MIPIGPTSPGSYSAGIVSITHSTTSIETVSNLALSIRVCAPDCVWNDQRGIMLEFIVFTVVGEGGVKCTLRLADIIHIPILKELCETQARMTRSSRTPPASRQPQTVNFGLKILGVTIGVVDRRCCFWTDALVDMIACECML